MKYIETNSRYIYLLKITIVIFFAACKNISGKNNQLSETTKPKQGIIKKPSSSFSDTVVISGKAAVFFSPDSLQMEKIQSVNKKEIFAMLGHDCYYQMKNAKAVFQEAWPQIKIIEVSRARYLLFVKNDKTKTCIDLNDKNDICGILLFDGEKKPALADMPNIETVLRIYFLN